MNAFGKLSPTRFQGKLSAANKRNEIDRHKLRREFAKLDEMRKSDLRMLETSRQRFRSRYKKLEVSPLSCGSDAIDVRMYDTHNPGFCYHRTGAIKESGLSPRKKTKDTYEIVRSMLFTDGEVDPDKLLCLHLFAAHSIRSPSTENIGTAGPVARLLEHGKQSHFSGAWNNILPCYVIDLQRDPNSADNLPDNLKYHKDSRERCPANENGASPNAPPPLTNEKLTKMLPSSLGRMPLISPHIYSLLAASQELRIKQAIAEGCTRKRFKRSSTDFDLLEEKSLSFRLDDEDDFSDRVTSTCPPALKGTRTAPSRVSTLRSSSRRSTFGSTHRFDRSIAMLRPRNGRAAQERPRGISEAAGSTTEVITIKPSCRAIRSVASRTSSTKSPFQNAVFNDSFSQSSYSFVSGQLSPGSEVGKCSRFAYLNRPARSYELKNRAFRTVPILVNNQIEALVHSVLDVLGRVNPEKTEKIVRTARDPEEIARMLARPDIHLFAESLAGQPLVSSSSSFVVSDAAVVDEIDVQLEKSLQKELVALTLRVPPAPGLDALVAAIRRNLFVDVGATSSSKDHRGSLRVRERELPVREERQRIGEEVPRKAFDMSDSCDHEVFQEHKTTCASCYDKWKSFLTDNAKKSGSSEAKGKIGEKNIGSKNETGVRMMEEFTVKLKRIGRSDRSSATPKRKKDFASTCENHSENVARTKEREKKGSISTSEKKMSRKQKLLENSELRSKSKTGGDLPSDKERSKVRKEAKDSAKPKVKESSSIVTNIAGRGTGSGYIFGIRSEQDSSITLHDNPPSPKCQFKPWKATQDPGYFEPDRVMLRRMTNPQRILVGQLCASLKTRKINNEGLVEERMPLAALVAPILSRESINILTRGTVQSKENEPMEGQREEEEDVTVTDQLTGPLLAKIRQEVAEIETERRLRSFLTEEI